MEITKAEARLIIDLIGIAEHESLIGKEEIKLAEKIAKNIPVSKRFLKDIKQSI